MKDFRQLQKRELWGKFYGYINLRTATADDSLSEDEKRSFRLVHELTGLMLRKDIFSLLKLCFLCMKHRDVVHGKKHPNIAVAMLRGFFYPFIWAYSTTNFDY